VNPQEARRRFASARVARLATVGADGAPHLVPVVFALLGDTVYSVVDQKPKRTTELRRLANVRATGRAALLVDHYEENWQNLWWVRADGRARILDPDEPEARRSIEALIERYPQQHAIGPVLAVDVEHWSGWLGGGGHSASG
jgi:PPOX class probable F420-dependent enzyme